MLEWLFLTRGVPKHIRSDNGPEFVARAVCRWLGSSGCQALFITPGSPWENGYIESFFDKLRDECLNREVFRPSKKDRPHSSLDYLTPAELVRRYYGNKQAEEAGQSRVKAGTLSL